MGTGGFRDRRLSAEEGSYSKTEGDRLPLALGKENALRDRKGRGKRTDIRRGYIHTHTYAARPRNERML